MAVEEDDKNRLVSLGLERPEILEGGTIYVDLGYDINRGLPSAVAYSDERFTYHSSSLAGDMLTKHERYATTRTGSYTSSWHLGIDEFVTDLTASNNGVVSYQRLMEDASRLVGKVLDAKTFASKTTEMLEIRTPHIPKLGSAEKP